MAKAGYEMGKEVVKQLEQKYGIKKWSAKEFAEIFVKGYFEETGTEPEIIAESDKQVIYRLHNCIFFELALEKPNLTCDVLHRQFYQGVCAAIGKNAKDSQRTCMEHGDNYCEHIIEWT